MQYQVTRQYAKDKELPFAEFADRSLAVNFLAFVSERDMQEKCIRIYRLFENGQFTQAYNVERLTVSHVHAQYASGDNDLPIPFAEPFSIMRVSLDDTQTLIAKFTCLNLARDFVQWLFPADPGTYLILNGKQFIEKINTTSMDQQATEQAQKQRAAPKASFRPTPFMTQLRMGPPNWLQDENDDKKDNEDKE